MNIKSEYDPQMWFCSWFGRKRNKYRMVDPELKIRSVELAKQKDPKTSAEHYHVPLKSLKRWMKVGCYWKKGGGRKTKDPALE